MTHQGRLGGLVLIAVVIATLCYVPAGAQDSQVQIFTVPGSFFVGVLSSDGTQLAMFEDGNLQAFDLAPAALIIHVLDLTTGEVRAVGAAADYTQAAAFTQNDTRLVTLHGNGLMYVRDLATASIAQTFGIPYDLTNTMIMLPDGTTAVAMGGYPEPSVILLDTTSGAITAVMTRHIPIIERRNVRFPNAGTVLAVSPEGKTAAVATMLDDIWLWNLETGEWSVLLDTEQDVPMLNIRAMAFTPDGQRLAYHFQDDEAVHVVDLASGSEVLAVPGIAAPAFAFSPDGARIAWMDPELTTLSVAPLEDAAAPTTIALPAPPLEDYNARLNPRTTVLKFTPDGSTIVLSGFMSMDGTNAVYLVTLP